jgi:RND family efflux transporter MFP subunit
MKKTNVKNMKNLFIFGGIAIAAISVWAVLHFTKNPVFSQTQLYEVKKGIIESEISESIMLESGTDTQLAFENAGKIKDVYVSVGDEVKKDQLLAEEVNSDYVATLNGATAARDAAAAQLEQAKEDVKIQSNKTKSLRKSDTANKYDVKAQKDTKDKSEAGVDAAEALLESAQSAVERASLQLKKTRLLAPADGTITEKNIEAGEVVAQAAQVMTLSSTGDLQASAQVSELDVKKISVGDNAQIEISSIDQKDIYINAKVKNIYPSGTMEDGGTAYKVEFILAEQNADLKPGMTGTATIKLSQKTGVVNIPQSSLFTSGNEKYVMVLSGGLPEKKIVQVGAYGSGGTVEILSGLAEGDKIIQF